MPLGRLYRLLVVAVPAFLGMAAGVGRVGAMHAARPPGTGAAGVVSTIGTPRQSLPTPVHNEATCAFCQAAIFPPCAPQPASVSIESLGVVRQECGAADEAAPRFTTHRLTTTRAPPALRPA